MDISDGLGALDNSDTYEVSRQPVDVSLGRSDQDGADCF